MDIVAFLYVEFRQDWECYFGNVIQITSYPIYNVISNVAISMI